MTSEHRFRLSVLPGRFAICQVAPDQVTTLLSQGSDFLSITWTADEVSAILPEVAVPAGTRGGKGWLCLKVEGPLDFSEVGILAGLATTLAERAIPIFAVSTYSTDYLLIRATDEDRAVCALAQAGYTVDGP